MPPHFNLPPFRPEIVATGCYSCPAGTICACPTPPTDLYCSTSTCRHYIPARSIKSTIASCHTCFTATCTLCRGPYHSPSPSCPAEHTASGLVFTIRSAYLNDLADFGQKEAALRRVYDEAVRENQSITWECAHMIGERLLRNHRARLDAERARVCQWVESRRQERMEKFIKDMEAALNEENNTVLARLENAASTPDAGGN